MSLPKPESEAKTRTFSAFWWLPIIAFIVSGWMIYRQYAAKGPLITIEFETAEGIAAGKTKIKALSVDIGLVESVTLMPDLKHVEVKARLNSEISPMLNENAKFWVVRPRIGSSGISGLDTILSGAYIEFAPAKGKESKRRFKGLQDLPEIALDAAGLHIRLIGDSKKSLSKGSPVLYRGFEVGRIQKVNLDMAKGTISYDAFVEAPYHQLITSNTRFWDAGGFELLTSTEGIKLRTGTIESIISGGIAFDLPRGMTPGSRVNAFHEFNLYRDLEATLDIDYKHAVEYIILVDDSIRGLSIDAPVEYRGVPIGKVTRTYMSYSDIEKISPTEDRIPILLEIEPARLGFKDDEYSVAALQFNMKKWVSRGLTASLKPGNLITGSLYVDLDNREPKDGNPKLIFFDKYPVIPYESGGLSQVQDKIFGLLDKLQGLPLEETFTELAATLAKSRTTFERSSELISTVDKFLQKNDMQQLPEEFVQLMQESKAVIEDFSKQAPFYRELNLLLVKLTQTLSEARPLIREVRNRPNSLIFDSGDREPDETPTPRQ